MFVEVSVSKFPKSLMLHFLCRNVIIPVIDTHCERKALLTTVKADSAHFLEQLQAGMSWNDFRTACERYQYRYGFVQECKEIIKKYLSTRILLCWFHVKAAWHDSLLTKV